MKWATVRSRDVCLSPYETFVLMAQCGAYGLGFIVHDWGFRIMLIWIHICIHKKRS